MIQWTIDSALASRYVDTVVVSTDDPMAKSIARAQGVDVIDRPAAIADSSATAAAVIAHVLLHRPEDVLVYLQPTSPLREARDIDACLELLFESEGVVSVTETVEHPEWMYRLDEKSLKLEPVLATARYHGRQDLPKSFKLNGAVYCAPSELLRPDGDIFKLQLTGYEMPQSRSVDIDTVEDFRLTELLLGTNSR